MKSTLELTGAVVAAFAAEGLVAFFGDDGTMMRAALLGKGFTRPLNRRGGYPAFLFGGQHRRAKLLAEGGCFRRPSFYLLRS